jgi:hypothetical protein
MADTTTTPVNIHGGHTSKASRPAWEGWILGQVQAETGLGLFDRSMAALLSGYGHDLPSPQRRAALLDSIKRVKGR